jgi:ophiobolin F synthase
VETGGLFRLLTRLLLTVSPRRDEANLDRLACLLGRYFQIRDDYQNIVSVDASTIYTITVHESS